MSAKIYKWNRFGMKQERIIMLTNKAVYNISKTKIKRRIEITKIAACTVSKKGVEFVLHVPSEYDYRYGSQFKRDVILDSLHKIYYSVSGQKLLPFFYKVKLSTVVVL